MKEETFVKSLRNHYRNIVKPDFVGTMEMTFNVLVTKEDDILVAHCLELDIVATGGTLAEAQRDVIDLIYAQVNYAFTNNNLENLFHPAPREVWELFFSIPSKTMAPALKSTYQLSMRY